MEQSASPIAPGDIVAGKYRVDRVLGQGGMGVVVAATHEHLDQRVALKFLLPGIASHPEVVGRFVREARSAVKIQSEHVARVLDVGTLDNGTPYMVMEYLEGQDVAQMLAQRGPLPVAEAVDYVLQACEAVAEAHSIGIVHRDLKPPNMFLARRATGKPIVKVLDFGISKIPASDRDAIVTQAASIMGSPGYMSPEQMQSASTVDVRSDIWSMGIVIYELLAGKLPFPAETMPEMVAAILTRPHVPLSALRGDVPVGVHAVIDRCLEKDVAKRFPNIAELARALAPFGPARSEQHVERIDHLLGLAAQPLQPATTGSGIMARPDNLTFSPMTSQASGATSRLLVPAVVLGVAAAGAVAFLALRKSPASPLTLPVPSAVAAATVAPPSPSASATASSAPPAASSVSLAPLPAPPPVPVTTATVPTPGPGPAPRPTAKPGPTPAPTAAPTCHVVSYFDADGNKHFKQECQ